MEPLLPEIMMCLEGRWIVVDGCSGIVDIERCEETGVTVCVMSYFPTQFLISTLLSNFTTSTPDHRNLLGLFHVPTLTTKLPDFTILTPVFKEILNVTAPYITIVWKVYNDITHTVTPVSSQRSMSTIPEQPSPHYAHHLIPPPFIKFLVN